MQTSAKAGWMLAIAFLVGGATGILGGGALRQWQERPRANTGPGPGNTRGFVASMVELLEPQDAAQREALQPLLEYTDGRNRSIVDGARLQMRTELDSLRTQIAPLLSPEQLVRFDAFRRRSAEPGQRGGGPRGLPGDAGRRPPPGRGRGNPDGPPR